ncbi:SPOR domain-containing protein [Treponema sp.]
MEKRKLLLIVVSVGVFLVIAVGATLIIFAPKTKESLKNMPISAGVPSAQGQAATESPTGNASTGPASVDASEWVRNPSSLPGLQPPAPGTSSSRGDVIIIYGDNTKVPEQGPANLSNGDDGQSITITAPQTRALPEPAKDLVASLPKSVKEEPVKAKEAPKVQSKSPAKTAPKASAAPVSDTYWVQTGSFAAKTRADGAKETLSSKGISSLLETKELNGKTFYRVRVGPYASKSEADYWLSLVKTIDGFDQSYVSLVKARN